MLGFAKPCRERLLTHSLIRDHAAAEDVAHDCYCRLLRRADIYDLPRDGTKLLYRAITNACINRFQRDGPCSAWMWLAPMMPGRGRPRPCQNKPTRRTPAG